MSSFSKKLGLLLLVWFAACASYRKAPDQPTSTAQGSYANGPAADTYAVETSASNGRAPAPAATGGGYATKRSRRGGAVHDSASIAEATPRERPGLGTSFGETRTSYVDEAPFLRATYEPFATVALHYNDAEGVAAQVAYHGGPSLAPLYARTPAGGISVSVQDDGGSVLDGVHLGDRTYVVGRDGARYSLVIQNNTGGRFELVASVDGLDVIDGRPADVQKRGYLLAPYSSLTIDGFRTSASTVAAFRFGAVGESYAAKTSGDRNVGVIGVAFFAERGSAWTRDELERRESADPFPGDRSYSRPPR